MDSCCRPSWINNLNLIISCNLLWEARLDNCLTIFYTTYPRLDDSLPLI